MTTRRHGGRPKLSDDQEAAICREYQAGGTCTALAVRFGVTAATVCAILRRRGVGLRRRAHNVPPPEPILLGDGTARIPLLNGAGDVCAHTRVEIADLPLLVGRRWHLMIPNPAQKRRYAVMYERVAGQGHQVGMHRVILGLQRGDPLEPDHINNDGLDNRRSNLRVLTKAENVNRNPRPQLRRAPRSGSRGVYWDAGKGRWRAAVWTNGKRQHVGWFSTQDEAVAAVVSAAATR